MGLSASKRVSQSITNSPDFNSACDSVYDASLSLAQHAFAGIKPYQLLSAAERLHNSLQTHNSLPLISKWVKSTPDQAQVDQALKHTLSRRSNQAQEPEGEILLDRAEFKEFAVDLFTNAVVSQARNEVLKKVPIGVAGIAGIGLAVRPGKEVIGTVIGVYAIGVATAVYVSLTG